MWKLPGFNNIHYQDLHLQVAKDTPGKRLLASLSLFSWDSQGGGAEWGASPAGGLAPEACDPPQRGRSVPLQDNQEMKSCFAHLEATLNFLSFAF